MTAIAPVLEAFFTDRLMTQQAASPHTIASYRDTFRLLLRYLQETRGRQPSSLDFADLDAPVIGGFLSWLETSRGSGAATRNNRLAAIHSLFRYAALRAPEHAALISRVLDIQARRTATTLVSYLQPAELDAILAAPDRSAWHGRCDHTLRTFAAQTGLRVSEITALTTASLHLGTGPHVYCHGKGRKDRCTPLTSHTRQILTAWLATGNAGPDDPLFCTRSGTPMSTDAVARMITKHARTAARACPSLTGKTITPHTLRHTAAMTLLHADVDTTVIALWLGTKAPPAPASTSTPTWRSRKTRSPAPPRRAHNPAATSHPTRCSHSSNSSDPSEPRRNGNAAHDRLLTCSARAHSITADSP